MTQTEMGQESLLSTAQFHWADYLVFVLVLAASCGVGLYYAFCQKNNTTDDYLMGGRNMAVLPVTLSLYISFISAISFLGDPVEVYKNGSVQVSMVIGYTLALIFMAVFVVPQFHKTQITSAYELLELRLGKTVRMIGAFGQLLFLLLYLSIALYAPSLVISQATGLSVRWTIVIVISISTFYTTLGGLKAVVWVDAAQTSIMVAGIVALQVEAVRKLGGIHVVLHEAKEAGRMEPWWLGLDVFGANFWGYTIGAFFRLFSVCCVVQYMVQRICSVSSPFKASCTLYLCIPTFVIIGVMMGFNGLLLAAYYKDCDPLASGQIERSDQLIPLMFMELFQFAPGVSGLFTASICTAALSTLSSGQSGLAVNLLKDFIEPIYTKLAKKPLNGNLELTLARVLSGLGGVILMVLAFIIMKDDSNVFVLSYKLAGCILGPVAALFSFAMFFPRINTLDVIIGFVVGLAVPGWIVTGSIVYDYVPPVLPVSTRNCFNTSLSTYNGNHTLRVSPAVTQSISVTIPQDQDSEIWDLYRISYLWFTTIGYILTMLFGFISYCISVLLKKLVCKESEKSDPDIKDAKLRLNMYEIEKSEKC